MPTRILLSTSVVLILVAGVFTWQARPKIETLKSDLIATKASLSDTTKSFAKAKDDLKSALTIADKAKAQAETATNERNSLKAEANAAKASLKEATDAAAAATAQLEDLKKQVADGQNNDGTATSSMAAVEAKLKEAETKLGELETVNQTLTQKNADNDSKLAGLVKAEQSRIGKQMAKGLTGQVLAVNNAYNFVVLSLGDKQGVVMNGEMLVKRGGAQVAKVKITSVEPTTSIADVVPGTAPRGVRVQAGDEVIYPGAGI